MKEDNDNSFQPSSLKPEPVISREPDPRKAKVISEAEAADLRFKIQEKNRVSKESINKLCDGDCLRFWCCCFATDGVAAKHNVAVS